MLRTVLSFVAFFMVGIGFAHAGSTPSEVTYLYFIQGNYAGKSVVEITEKSDIYVYTSTSEIKFGDFAQTLSCRTEIEKTTLRPRFFRYEGVLNGGAVSGTLRVEGDTLHAETEIDGDRFASTKEFIDPSCLFQDYIPEHQIVILNKILAVDEMFVRFNVLLPSNQMSLAAVITIESELELPTHPRPTVGKKYAISIQNSSTYYSYLDPKRNIPVYMDFPVSQTEVFLEGAFGENPRPKYVAPEEPE